MPLSIECNQSLTLLQLIPTSGAFIGIIFGRIVDPAWHFLLLTGCGSGPCRTHGDLPGRRLWLLCFSPRLMGCSCDFTGSRISYTRLTQHFLSRVRHLSDNQPWLKWLGRKKEETIFHINNIFHSQEMSAKKVKKAENLFWIIFFVLHSWNWTLSSAKIKKNIHLAARLEGFFASAAHEALLMICLAHRGHHFTLDVQIASSTFGAVHLLIVQGAIIGSVLGEEATSGQTFAACRALEACLVEISIGHP